MQDDVPDSIRPYLNEISDRLWDGRAAVMVGAGFSKNAGRGFPDWNQLGDLFYQKAHGTKPDPANPKYLNALRLAEEVQAAIGRPALENLLRSNIPDSDIEPSELHVRLLKLPWVDVFTTNYDTLLERASAKVITRRYEPVVNKEDIPYAIKPRIVKLHGSFPSERPFIITEEDYRRYPHDNAPFVNTVQQALLENTFCLIGFSGDDPNFLQWIGWIRDNLGKDKTQKIYLVGMFDLSPARVQLMTQRGIIVVDLSRYNGIGKHDHPKALHRFFDYIQSKKPDALDWPHNPKKMYPTHEANRIEEIQAVTKEWQHQRLAYPGWLILPHGNRNTLWNYTTGWVNCLPDLEKSSPELAVQYVFELIWRLDRCLLPIFDSIAKYCEKLLEKYCPFQNGILHGNCQIPSQNGSCQTRQCDKIREAWLAIAMAMLRFHREEGNLNEWNEAESRLWRLSSHLSTEQKEFLNYQGVLFSLFTLDLPKTKQRLETWRPNESQPYWMSKRAAILAELGHYDSITEIITLALNASRKKNNTDSTTPDYHSISNESFQILLLRYVKDAREWTENNGASDKEQELIKESQKNSWQKKIQDFKPDKRSEEQIQKQEIFNNFDEYWSYFSKNCHGETKKEWDQELRTVRNIERDKDIQQQNARLDELKAFRCDPWNEVKLFELTLKNPPTQQKTTTQKQEFDIGQISQTYHLGITDTEALSAFTFLRFCEDAGLPYRIGSTTMTTKTAIASLQRISRYSSFWAMSTLARLGDTKAADSLFNRENVSRFTATEADQLIQSYLEALDKCRDDIHAGNAFRNDSFAVRLAALLPEVISRLCCKCSNNIKHKVLKFVIETYNSPAKANYKNIRNLTTRLISSIHESDQYRIIPDLLKFKIQENSNLLVKNDFLNPFLLIELKKNPEHEPKLEISSGSVNQLLQQSASDNTDHRRWSLISLITLHKLQLLDDENNKELAEVLWLISDQYGLPDGTDYYKFAFLGLPHPEGICPAQLFKDYVKATPFPIQNNAQDNGVRMTGGALPIVHEIIGANDFDKTIWTEKDAAEILQRLLEWWDADKKRLSEARTANDGLPPISEEFRARFARLTDLLSEVIGSKLSTKSSNETRAYLERLLKELQEHELPTLEAEAACLHIYPDRKTDVYSRINNALTSGQNDMEHDGLKAIAKIFLAVNDCDMDSAEPELVSLFNQYLTWCPTRSLSFAFWIIVRILKKSESSFPTSLHKVALRRLGRLFEETKYDTDNPNLNFDEKLEIRRISSILAATLWTHYNSRSEPVPEVIEKWRETCLDPDEFAEIRNPWGFRSMRA